MELFRIRYFVFFFFFFKVANDGGNRSQTEEETEGRKRTHKIILGFSGFLMYPLISTVSG